MTAKAGTALLAAAALLAGGGPGHAAGGIAARIDVRDGQGMELVAIVERASDAEARALTYRFEVIRSGAGGRSRSVQSGRAAPAPGAAQIVGRAGLGGTGAATVEARLEVMDGARPVASATLRLPPEASNQGESEMTARSLGLAAVGLLLAGGAAADDLASLRQQGFGQSAYIEQAGGARADLRQLGHGNRAYLDQQAGAALVSQDGEGHELRLAQRGRDVRAAASQAGSGQRAALRQDGGGLTLELEQQGGDNAASLRQDGILLRARVRQDGRDMQFSLLQQGSDLVAAASQVGRAHSAEVVQDGDGLSLELEQQGAERAVRVTQTAATPALRIVQR